MRGLLEVLFGSLILLWATIVIGFSIRQMLVKLRKMRVLTEIQRQSEDDSDDKVA